MKASNYQSFASLQTSLQTLFANTCKFANPYVGNCNLQKWIHLQLSSRRKIKNCIFLRYTF